VLIPFTILDAILVNKPTLERSQLLVYPAHHLRRFDEFRRWAMRFVRQRQREPGPFSVLNLVIASGIRAICARLVELFLDPCW
jgi:hypothetical protein